MTPGKYIKQIRTKNKMTQMQVSKQLGFDNAIMLSMIENDRAKIPLARAVDFCNTLMMNEAERLKLRTAIINQYRHKVFEVFADKPNE